jgi:hypothetical protein
MAGSEELEECTTGGTVLVPPADSRSARPP